MQQQHGLIVTVKAEQPLPHLDEDLRVLLFQTIRELLFNVAKHAGVTEAAVTLGRGSWAAAHRGERCGRGFDPSVAERAEASSQGLLRAERRLQLLGGRVEVQSRPGEGTRAAIRLRTPRPYFGEEQ